MNLIDQLNKKITHYATRVIDRVGEKLPPSSKWKYERQTNPPTFGWARRVSDKFLNQAVDSRRPKCEAILKAGSDYCSFVPGKFSIVVLSCKRWEPLERLINSMQVYFNRIDTYKNFEKILVDNGSGEELLTMAKDKKFFDEIIALPKNVGMVGALRQAFPRAKGEYIMFVEDDFVLEAKTSFLQKCHQLFLEFPEIGLIRLKNQNNWWKPHRLIAPLRETSSGTKFWTWLPTREGSLNGWAAGSVVFRKVSYFQTGELPDVKDNPPRTVKRHQGYIYECEYGKKFNQTWLAAKLKNLYPFFQPNDNDVSSGWGA